jgi:PAS domain S-box-containing protein
MSGYAREEVIGRPIPDFDTEQSSDQVQKNIEHIIAVGQAIFETKHRRKDGSALLLEVSATWSDSVGGKFVAFLRDITGRKRAEKEVAESKALLAGIVENIPLMVFLKEAAELRFVIFNRAGEELLGYPREELIGKNNLDLFPTEQAAQFMSKDREVLDGQAGFVDIPEEPIATAKRGERLLHTRKVCIRGADGNTRFLLGISEDITERKKAEENLRAANQKLTASNEQLQAAEQKLRAANQQLEAANLRLRENEARLSTLFEATADGILITDHETMMFRHANRAMCEMLGYAEEELITLGVRDIHPKDALPAIAAKLEAQLRGARTPGVELPCLRKDGSVFYADVSAARLTVDGRACHVAMFRDTTERREAESRQKMLTEVLECTTDLVSMATPDRKVFYFNRNGRQLVGIPADADLSAFQIPSIHPDWAGQLVTIIGIPSAVRYGVWSGETAVLAPDGREIPVSQVIMAHKGPSGEVECISTIIRDISRQKAAEAELQKHRLNLEELVRQRTIQLEAANGELESFSYSVSHDLRAPLRAMDGFSQALLDEYSPSIDEQGRDYLARVRAATRRMAQLIDDMLQLARVSRTAMRRETVDLSALARAAAERLRKDEPGRRVEFAIAPDLRAEGDAALLEAALNNLIENAWKFTSKKSPARIEVGADASGGGRTFFVRDDGAGFDMAYADKLFSPFQRLHSLAEFPGTGIGLATVRSIVKRHGGRVWAEAAVDKGATFYFTV